MSQKTPDNIVAGGLFGTAYENYRKFTKSARNENTRIRFVLFLGLKEGDSWTDYFTNQQAVERAAWMAGPDAEIKYKIWRARQQHSEAVKK